MRKVFNNKSYNMEMKYLLLVMLVFVFLIQLSSAELEIGINDIGSPQVNMPGHSEDNEILFNGSANSSYYWGIYPWVDYDMPTIKSFGYNQTQPAIDYADGKFVNRSGDIMQGTLLTQIIAPKTSATYNIGDPSLRYSNAYITGTYDGNLAKVVSTRTGSVVDYGTGGILSSISLGGGGSIDMSATGGINLNNNVVVLSGKTITADNICYSNGVQCVSSSANPFDQDLNTTANVTFAKVQTPYLNVTDGTAHIGLYVDNTIGRNVLESIDPSTAEVLSMLVGFSIYPTKYGGLPSGFTFYNGLDELNSASILFDNTTNRVTFGTDGTTIFYFDKGFNFNTGTNPTVTQDTSSTQYNISIIAANVTGSNKAGGSLILSSGASTGNAGSTIVFKTAQGGGIGSTARTPTETLTLGLPTSTMQSRLTINNSETVNDNITIGDGNRNTKLTLNNGGSASYDSRIVLGTASRDWTHYVGGSSTGYKYRIDYTGTDTPISRIIAMDVNGEVDLSNGSVYIQPQFNRISFMTGVSPQGLFKYEFNGTIGSPTDLDITLGSSGRRINIGYFKQIVMSAGGSGNDNSVFQFGTATRDWTITARNVTDNYRLLFEYIGTDSPWSRAIELDRTGRYMKVNGTIISLNDINATNNLGVLGSENIAKTLTVGKNLTVTDNVVINGNLSVKRPYGMFSSTQTQTVAGTATATPVTFNITEDNFEILKSTDNANFSVQQSGDYLIEISAVVSTTSGSNKHIEIWSRKNNVNVPRSNTKVEIATSGQEQVIAVPFILDLNTTDQFSIMWASDSTNAQLLFTQNTSYSPSVPSIIMTATKLSEVAGTPYSGGGF